MLTEPLVIRSAGLVFQGEWLFGFWNNRLLFSMGMPQHDSMTECPCNDSFTQERSKVLVITVIVLGKAREMALVAEVNVMGYDL